MLLNDFIDIMNKLAPQETALGFDNVGLIIGTDRKQIKRVLVALDCTLAVALEAVEIGIKMAEMCAEKGYSSASFRVMAGSCAKFAVPRRTENCSTFSLFIGRATPISTGNTSIPSCFAIRHTVDSPRPIFSATVAVTSCPHCVTPSATTPLSAQKTTAARLEISGTG